MELISVMPDYIKSPDLTADWENKLLQVEKGNLEAEAFMKEIRELVSQILMDCRNVSDADRCCLVDAFDCLLILRLPVQVITPCIIRPDFFTHRRPRSVHGRYLYRLSIPLQIS